MRDITKTLLDVALLVLLFAANNANAGIPSNHVAKYLVQSDASEDIVFLDKINSTTGVISGSLTRELNGYVPLGYSKNDGRLYLFEKDGGNQYKSCSISSAGQLACNQHTLPSVVNYEAGVSEIKFNDEGDLAYISSSRKIQVCTLSPLDGSILSCGTIINAPMSGTIENIEVARYGTPTLFYSQSGVNEGIYSCFINSAGTSVSNCVSGGPTTVYKYPLVVDEVSGVLYTGNSKNQLVSYELNAINNSIPRGTGKVLRTVPNAELTGLAINERNNKLYTMFSNSITGAITGLDCSLEENFSCINLIGNYSRGNIWVSYGK